MKPLDEIMVSETILKMLLGGLDIKYQFPVEKAKKKGGKDRKQQVSLQTILNQGKVDAYGQELFDQPSAVKSFDSRFDKKHPVKLMVDYIRQNSIRKDILSQIYNNSACVKAHRMVGKFGIYNDLLTSDQRNIVELRLKWEDQQRIERKEMAEKFFK